MIEEIKIYPACKYASRMVPSDTIFRSIAWFLGMCQCVGEHLLEHPQLSIRLVSLRLCGVSTSKTDPSSRRDNLDFQPCHLALS